MGVSCYIHEDQSSIGACVGCGKFICQECNTEVKRKNYCKTCIGEIMTENQSKIEKLEESKNNANPMVFMNAGGGGGQHLVLQLVQVVQLEQIYQSTPRIESQQAC